MLPPFHLRLFDGIHGDHVAAADRRGVEFRVSVANSRRMALMVHAGEQARTPSRDDFRCRGRGDYDVRVPRTASSPEVAGSTAIADSRAHFAAELRAALRIACPNARICFRRRLLPATASSCERAW